MANRGWPQNLDNGVMRKPTSPFTGSRTSKSMDFEAIIAKGDNSNGQTTIAPAEVSRGGQTAGRGYEDYHWGKQTDGDRFGRNPNLNEGFSYDAVPSVSTKKKK